MQRPFLSFAVGFLIYFLLLGFFAFLFFKKLQMPQVALEVDAELVSDISAHEKSKSREEKSDLEKISSEKNAQQKSSEEKLEPHKANANKEESEVQKNSAKKIPPLFQPLPEIPQELRYEAFNSKAVARFHVDAAGNVVGVDLIKPTSNPKLNQLLLKSLRKWKFAASRSGITQDIAVNFTVE